MVPLMQRRLEGGGTQAPGARFASHLGAVNKFTV